MFIFGGNNHHHLVQGLALLAPVQVMGLPQNFFYVEVLP